MREIIQQLIATEETARDIVQKARAEGDQIIQTARARAAELLEHSGAEVQRDAQQLLQTSAQQAVADERQRLAQADAQIASEIQVDPETRQAVVQAVVRCVCGLSPGTGAQERQHGASERT